MTQVSRANGWTVDTTKLTLAWADHPAYAAPRPLPDATLAALTYFGLGYLESQAAARSVNDKFRKDALAQLRATNPDAKADDVDKATLPRPDSDAYRAELRTQHEALFEKLLAGYEVGVREGGADPVEEEADKIARMWLQGLATQFTYQGKPWYTLPAKRKVARDDDHYDGPKYDTFGEALRAFRESTSPASGKLVGRTADGKAWPFKIRNGMTVAEAIAAEAARRVAERAEAKPTVSLGGDGAEVEF